MSNKTCIRILRSEIEKVHDTESYGRFSGEVYMAYLLGFISDGERWGWIAEANKRVEK